MLLIGVRTQILFSFNVLPSIDNSEKNEKKPIPDEAGDSEEFLSELYDFNKVLNSQ